MMATFMSELLGTYTTVQIDIIDKKSASFSQISNVYRIIKVGNISVSVTYPSIIRHARLC